MMEFFRGELLPASLEALGQARRLGTTFGLSVYALVPLPSEPDSGDEDLTARCGRYGADKVVMLTGEGLQSEGEMRFACYAGALLAACSQLPPRLLLLGDTPAARDIAPRLASRLGAAYLPRGAALEVEGQLVLCDETGSHVMVESEAIVGEGMPPAAPPPVLMTVPPGRFQMASGAQDAEMMIIAAADCVQTSDATPVAAAGFTEEGLDVLPLASRLVGPGPQDEDAVAPAPALWRLQAGTQGLAAADTAQFRIVLDADIDKVTAADYVLAVSEAELATTRTSLLDQLALPAPPKAASQWSSRSDLSEPSQFTPTGELDGWGDGETAPTGDTDTTREVVAAPPTPRLPEDPPPPVIAPPASMPIARGPVPVAFDESMWEGFATLPTPHTGEERTGEGSPMAEMATADTAPVPIVSLAGAGIARRSSDNLPSSSQSPQPAPSAQSPGRGASKAKGEPEDPESKEGKTAKEEAAAPAQGGSPTGEAGAGKPQEALSQWTEDP